MPRPLRLIDVPISLTSTEPYEKFLAEMQTLPQDDPQVRWAINQAKSEMARTQDWINRNPHFQTAVPSSPPE